MKRIWFGVGLMVLLLILGIGSSTLLQRTQQTQIERLDAAARLAAEGDWAAARALLAEAKHEWDKKQLLLAALTPHETIDHMEGLFAQLEVFSEARSAAAFSSTCVYLARQLEALGGSHSLSAENFF